MNRVQKNELSWMLHQAEICLRPVKRRRAKNLASALQAERRSATIKYARGR